VPNPKYAPDEPVKIDGHVEGSDGRTLANFHGDDARVVNGDTYRGSDGHERTVVQTRDGSIIAVPTKALRNRTPHKR
jgi:hypothetical protein